MISALDRLWERALACFRSKQLEEDFDAELAHHLDMLIEENLRLGHPPDEARRRAKQQLGGVEQTRELHRQTRGLPWFEQLGRDLQYACRQMLRHKAFASVCVTTIAVAIAACATVFSVMDGILFRPLPYGEPERLVALWEVANFGNNNVSGGAFRDWRDGSQHLDSIMIHAPVLQNLQRDTGSVRLKGWEVSASFLDVLDVAPLAGRGFLAAEEQVNGQPVVMLTEESWRKRFNADPDIIGSSVTLNGAVREVVGILPANTWLDPEVEFFIPAILDPNQAFRYDRSSHWALVLGRLKSNVSVAQLQAELRGIKESLNNRYPDYKKEWSVAAQPLHEVYAAGARPALWTLAAAVGLVLLIACANVANLLLARSTRRRGELAMRVALGARGSRLFQQSLTESFLLAAAGTVIGLVLALGGITLIKATTAALLPGAFAPALDGRAVAAAIAITAGATLLFGALPAWRWRKSDPNEALKNGGKSATAGGRTRSQSLLAIAEITLAVVLLSSAGLLLRSLSEQAAEDPGYNPESVVTFDLTLPDQLYRGPDKRIAYTRNVLERLNQAPGVLSVTSLSASPLLDGVRGEYISRQELPDTRFDYFASVIFVGGDFFETLQARLTSGRFLTSFDNQTDAKRVMVIDRKLAGTIFGEDEAVGQMLNYQGQAWEVVGVVENMNLDPNPRRDGYLYLPHVYFPFSLSMVVRTELDPTALRPALETALASVDAGVPMANFRTLGAALDATRAADEFILALIGTFAVIALLLACTGLYGVIAYTTATRQRELCIRRALGASPRNVLLLVLKDGGRLTALGLGIGLLATLGAGRLLSSQLYQVSPYDPAVIATTLALFAAVSLAAAWTPARRAAQIDPSSGLRSE